MQRALSLCCLLAALLSTAVLNAQTTNPFFRHIPPDAEQVYHINLAALGSKVSWDDISGLIPPPKSAGDQEMMKYVKDPSLSGIDFHQGFIIASSHLGKNADSPTCITILAQLSDSGKLLSLVRGKEKGLRTFKLPGKGSAAGKDKMAFAWNDKMVVVTVISNSSKHAQNFKGSTGSSSPYYTLTAAKKSMAALEGFTNSIYTTDATFINGFSDDADFHAWTKPGSLLSQLMEMSKKKNPFGDKMNIPKPQSNMHSLTAFRFDVGKITVHTTTIVPPDSARIYSIFNSRPLNPDLITHLPGREMLGMFNMHIAPSELTYLLEHYHTKHMVDSLLARNGLTFEDFTKALKGDFLIAAMAPSQMPDTGKVKPSVFFVTTIGDMGAFMKVIGKLGLNKDSTGGMLEKMKAGFTLRDNTLVIGPKGQTDAFFSTNNPANLKLVDDRIRNNAFSIVIDIKAISDLIKASNPNPTQKTQQMLHFVSALDRVTYAAGNYQNGQTEYNFEIKMADASENSLRSLLKLIH
ncbi:MAG: hypothetical protein BGO55_23850 [Sphingobacteriales bacterium 50-39]|nr:DUF4836 family protein [Sphingobacteriales bacterium]OJW58333.1 MAG: hypothetical protein BGO55_23850 [Sphingobacteriales bacterium 50-39]